MRSPPEKDRGQGDPHEKLMAVTSANLRATAKTKRSRAGGEILTWLPSGND